MSKTTYNSLAHEFKVSFGIDDLTKEQQINLLLELMSRVGLAAMFLDNPSIIPNLDATIKAYREKKD